MPEPGLANWTVYLDDNRNGQRDPGERFTTTDASGNYSFPNLGFGTYIVAEEQQPGWRQTAPASDTHTVTVTAGQIVTGIDFGTQQTSEPPVNHAPAFTSTAPSTTTTAQFYRYDATASDADHDPLTFDLVVYPAGMGIDSASGTIVWIPTADQAGTSDLTLRVQDGKGGATLQAFQITVTRPNTTPVITSVPHGPAVVGVPYSYLVAAQDADGDPVTFTLSAAPAGMTITAAGLITWTPGSIQVGSQHVAVIASDNRGASTTQTFELPVVATAPNRAPAITSSPRGVIRIGDTYLYQIAASDPDGDPLTHTLPARPAGMTVSPGGLVSWVPTAGQFGPNPVQVRVDDGRGGFFTQTFSINVVAQATNHPPAVTSTPPLSAMVGREYAYDLAGSDPDGDPLVWSLDAAPAGVSLDPARGTLRWTPTTDQAGEQSFIVRLSDGQGGWATQSSTVTVRAVNLPPGITSSPATQATVSTPYSYAVSAGDPDGDLLSFSLTAAPAGMTVSAAGLIQWTPQAGQVGSQNVVIRVEDGQGGFATQSYTVVVSATVPNQPPAITSAPPLQATAGQIYSYPVTASDSEGQAITFALLSAPAGMSIDPASGLISWTPTPAQVGLRQVIIAARDPQLAAGLQTFSVAVLAVNNPPTITSSPVQVLTAGLPYRYDIRAADPDGDPLSFTLGQHPAGLGVDPLGRVTWSPGVADVGVHRVEITVSDGRGASITQAYDLAVLADAQTPRVNLSVSGNPVPLGSPVTFVVTATDNVGVVSRSLTINGNPVALDGAGRVTLLASPAGSYTIVASATDAAGNTGLASTSLLVIDTSDVEAPDVDITSPAEGAVLTAPVDVVGTASDSNLVSYVLETAPLGSTTFTEMSRGSSSVVNGVLGKLDTSVLANGTYTLRLTATDSGGNVSSVESSVDVAGDLKIGNFTLSFTDVSIPVSGLPVTVSRTYDSLNAATADELGYGWRLEFRDTDLRTSLAPTGQEAYGVYNPFADGTRVYVTLPGGRREGFTFRPVRLSGFAGLFALYRPAFVADAGVTSALSVPDDVTLTRVGNDYYSLNSLPYNPADTLNFAGQYTVTTKDGLAYGIDAVSGDLLTLGDANGNVLRFSDASIDSNRGVRLTFSRDPQGQITAVTDPSGQKVRYAYDAKGDLASVTDREGNVTRFVYAEPARPHFLTEVIDPLGRTGVKTAYDAQGRLVKLIDAAGKEVQLVHDPANAIETVRDVLGHPTTFEYDTRGNVVTEVDARGGITRRSYDGANNVLSETDPLNHTTAYTRDGSGNVLTVTDPLGKVTRNTYVTFTPGLFATVRGARPITLLATTTDPLGNTTLNSYDSSGNLLSSTDAAGNVTRYAYDGAGNQTSVTDARGKLTRFEYDGRGNLARQTDALLHATDYTYDANGNQRTQTTTLSTPGGVRTLVTTTKYDASGRPTEVKDAEGHTTRTEYDGLGRQSAVVDALERRTEFRYDDRGRLVLTLFADGTSGAGGYDDAGRRVSSTDRAGRTTQFTYDDLGRLVETVYPDATPADLTDNPRTKTEYDKAGRVTAQVDERGNRTEFEYDDAGRQTVVRDALGHETVTEYDDAGRAVATTDALGHSTRFVYDALGRQVQTVFADNTSTSREYDALGRVVVDTDQLGRKTRYEYDALGRLTAVVDALSQRTEYGYDEAGDLVTQKDASNHVTRHEYDGLGRRIVTVLPLGQRSTTAYDAVGDVVSTTDFNQDTTGYEYDRDNRLAAKHFPDGTSVVFTYTATGQRATVTDARGLTAYAYDERDRLLSRTESDRTTISYTYDAAGNRTSVSTPAGTVTYTFDALNRLETVTDRGLGVTRYHYDNVSNLVRTELPNGTVETREYDEVNRLTYLENRGPAGVLSSHRYELALTGRRDAVAERDGRRVDYGYDALDRLTREKITDAIFGDRTVDYTYDPVGNRRTRDDSAEGLTGYAYDDNDRLLTEDLEGGITQYTYDDNGNTLSKVAGATDQAVYEWDFENRLIRVDVTDAGGTRHVVNRYDADGIRVAQLVDGEETRFLVDAVQPYAQVLLEYRPSGLVVASYVYALYS